MGLQLKITVIEAKSSGILILDSTGNYDAVTNPGGYGSPNPEKNTVAAILTQMAALGKILPAASLLSGQEQSDYLNGTAVPLSVTPLKDGVYDIRVLVGFTGPANITASGNSPLFSMSNASTVFQEAVGFSIDSEDPVKLYRIDRTKALTVSSGYTVENLPAVTNQPVTIYYEAQIYALVYDQGEACLVKDIAGAEISCDCSSEEVETLLHRYAQLLSMQFKFSSEKY